RSPTRGGEGSQLLNRTLYDITQLLESADDADARVRRVLELLGRVVPYEQCAMLEARIGYAPHIMVTSELPPDERTLLTGTLLNILGQLVDVNAGVSAPASRPKGTHLAVPLIGLDEVIGLLFVRSSATEYTEEHVRALSVVAAKLAAYFTTLRVRAELAELARERDEARRAAEAANRAKDEFLALVSHELKTPLSSILAWAHVLRSATGDAAAGIRAIDELERNVQTQAKLIDDVLDLACISSAALRLNLRMIEPGSLIKATVEGLRLEAERKSIRLESNLDDVADMPLVLDPDRIGQVVSILVANAIHFTPSGGQVEVRLERAAGYARIQVSDGGSGISRDDLPHVFDRFRPTVADRTRTSSAVGDALGVGLAIVKDLVELHGGRVHVESAGPEPGATFTVELPHPPQARAAGTPPAGEHADGRLLAGIRVLLVDHDVGLRESFEAVLHDYGAEVTGVASAAEALLALERQRPDVMLFGDLALQGEVAYDLMREVTARACPLPVASISSWRAEERERELAAGFRLHLARPLDIGALVDAVAGLAGRSRDTTPAHR
ncbi:MAG: two-component hybrid sensor and regulator, partial [bacterium]|nr:two-component hybrid sensor and regulator [bacterium]